MNLGFSEMIFIFFIALIIFGPKKLPEIGRQIGKALNDFKRASNEFKAQIESEISKLEIEETSAQILPPAPKPENVVASNIVAGRLPEETPVVPPPIPPEFAPSQAPDVAPVLAPENLAGLASPGPEPDPVSKVPNA